MVKRKYGFKQWLNRNYPDITAEPVYGVDAYILSGAMNDIDAFTYFQTPLDNGQYIVFIGMSAPEISKTITEIKAHGLPERPSNNRSATDEAPTTFQSFEAWLLRNGISYRDRRFQPHKTPQEVLAPLGDVDEIKGCQDVFYQRTWYLYNLDCSEHYFKALPHRLLEDGTVAVMAKASSSKYVSKRDRWTSNFNTMQSYLEQLIVALAQDNQEIAMNSAAMYCAALFECGPQQISVEYEKMKEELSNGTLTIYLRDRDSRRRPDVDLEQDEDF